jgi:transcriptional regulator with XRE-family HTH domain
MPDWVVAADIGERIERLRRLYGETQKSFAKRLRRSWKRLSAWENGKTPPRDVLEEACQENGWPLEIFTEGGRYPQDLITLPRMPQERRSSDVPPSGAGQSTERKAVRDLREAEAAIQAQLKRDYTDQGKSPPAYLIVGWLKTLLEAGGATPPDEPPAAAGTAGGRRTPPAGATLPPAPPSLPP